MLGLWLYLYIFITIGDAQSSNQCGYWSDWYCNVTCCNSTDTTGCASGTWTQKRSGSDSNCGSSTQTNGACFLLCPSDCSWLGWSDWNCRAINNCGSGSYFRTRSLAVPAQGGNCPGPSIQTGNACSLPACPNTPIDCTWSGWSTWSACTATCGPATQTQTRSVKQQAQHGGANCTGPSIQSQDCNNVPCPVNWSPWNTRSIQTRSVQQDCNYYNNCPVDCVWSDWSAWSTCSVACGEGTQTQTRYIQQQAQNGGAQCTGTTTQSQDCTMASCPINCVWSDWSAWSTCSVTCGEGTQTQTRSYQPSAAYGGAPCTGFNALSRNCTENSCPINCTWGKWSAWGGCIPNCGLSKQTQVRTITQKAEFGGINCTGPSSMTQNCTNATACTQDCIWEQWTSWGPCSPTCGPANSTRTRGNNADQPNVSPCVGPSSESQACYLPPCPIDCIWGPFALASNCSKPCGGGTEIWSRVFHVEPQFGGLACSGPATNHTPCNIDECVLDPVNCTWLPWSEWQCNIGQCSGNQTRIRSQNSEQNGGAPCDGNGTDTGPCQKPCNVDCQWSEWTAFSQCSVVCGGGLQTRNRSIATPATGTGRACSGDSITRRACNVKPCQDQNGLCGGVKCNPYQVCMMNNTDEVCLDSSTVAAYWDLIVTMSPTALLKDIQSFITVSFNYFFSPQYQMPTQFGTTSNRTLSIILGIYKTNETIAKGCLTFNETFVPFITNKTADFALVQMTAYEINSPLPPTALPQTPNSTDTWLGFKVSSEGAAIVIVLVIILVPLAIIAFVIIFLLRQKKDMVFEEFEQL